MANTHKDNNEIPLRAKEVLPGNRKDFSFCPKVCWFTLWSPAIKMQIALGFGFAVLLVSASKPEDAV